MTSFYQDRLGTNIGKEHSKRENCVFLQRFLREESAAKGQVEKERDALREEKKAWGRDRRRMIGLETKLREQIRELRGKLAQEGRQLADMRERESLRANERSQLERERSRLAEQKAKLNLEKEKHARAQLHAIDYSRATAQDSLIGMLEGSAPGSPAMRRAGSPSFTGGGGSSTYSHVSAGGGEPNNLGDAVDALEQLLGNSSSRR